MVEKRGQHGQQEWHDGRVADTRQRILQAAEELYYAGGYEHINLQTIADRLGLSKTALFHHFKNKQQLFFATLMQIGEHHYAMFAQAIAQAGPTAKARLQRIMERLAQESPFDVMRFMRSEYALLTPEQQQVVGQAWQRGMFDVVQRVLDDGVAHGELRQFDTTLATFTFLHLCLLLPSSNGAMYQGIQTNVSTTSIAVTDLLDLFLRGVVALPETTTPV